MRIVRLIYLNASFYAAFFVFSAVGIPAFTLFVALSAIVSPHRAAMRNFRRCIRLYGRVVTLLAYPLIRVRHEDLSGVDGPGPYIYVCNHRSMSDPFLMSLIPHEAVQVVNVWPFKIPVLGFYAKMAGYLSINAMPHEEFLERAEGLLKQGVSIIFFPEGTRSGGREMGAFHGSAFRLFQKCGVPIIPLCISGNEDIPRKGSLVLREGVIRVRALRPLRREDFMESRAYVVKNTVREIIQGELALMEGGA